MTNKILFIAVLIVSVSCITQIDQALTDYERQLVVEGGINNLPGPYTVRLNYTGDILGIEDRIRIPASSAMVSIEEEGGALHTLTETSPGVYQSDSTSLRGEVGRRYRLVFTLEEGKTYQTAYEAIPELPAVTSSDVDFQVFVIANETNPLQRTQVQQHVISVTLENNPANNRFYKFEAEGVQQRLIFPNLPIFPPEGCEEFFFGPSENGLTLNCWDLLGTIPNGIRLLSDELFDSPEITTDVLTVPFDDRGDYLATINIKAINGPEYEFWTVLNEQNNFRSDLFNPPLEAIVGNVIGVTDDKEVVAGYFSTHSVTQENVCISRINEQSLRPFPVTIANCFENCLTLFPNASWDVPEEFAECY